MALPPLSVKIGAETDGLTKGLTGAQAAIAKFAKVGAAGVAAVGVAMVALTKESLANIDVLTKQARSLGLTTAAFQKMSLVAGEAGVETGKLSSMLGLMQRNIVELGQGTQAQVDAFGRLGLSMRDLQGLEPDAQFAKIADALNKITDPAEKTAMAMEVFGRSGRDAINMLNGYGAAAANAAAFQQRFGIAVAQDVAQGVERANDAVGRLGMVFTGLGNQMAGAVAPSIERVANGLVEFAAKVVGARITLEEFFGSIEKARQVLGADLVNEIIKAGGSLADLQSEVKGVSNGMNALNQQTILAEGRLTNFADRLDDIGEIGASEVLRGFIGEMKKARQELEDGEIDAEDFRAKMEQLQGRVAALIAQFADFKGIDISGVTSQVTRLGQAVALALGFATQLRQELPGGRPGVTTGTGLTPEGSLIPPRRYTSSGRGTVNPTATDALLASMGGEFITGDDAGGGGVDPNEALREQLATRLETLMEGLMTERETVAQWYAEGQALIDSATDAELAAIGGKQAAIERLAKEHQDRLSRIRELGAAADLHTVLGAGAEILNAMGQTNEKALKVAKVFGAAQALIGAYQGAAEALKLPFPQNLAAAATVLAKGIGFVSAIKGVNKSGGAVASTGGATATAAAAPASAAAPQASQTLNFSVTNDPFGISDRLVRQIVGAINQSQRDGSTLIRATVS